MHVVVRNALVAGFKTRNAEAVEIMKRSHVVMGGTEISDEQVNERFERLVLKNFPGFR